MSDHSLNMRRKDALGEAMLALELAELSTRWAAQARNVHGASRISEDDLATRRVHLELADELAHEATELAGQALNAVALGRGNQAHDLREQVVSLEERVRMHCRRAGLSITTGSRPLPTGVLWFREQLPEFSPREDVR